eukprot:Clim_evm96s152 gene=Clim_evmTU96s152
MSVDRSRGFVSFVAVLYSLGLIFLLIGGFSPKIWTNDISVFNLGSNEFTLSYYYACVDDDGDLSCSEVNNDCDLTIDTNLGQFDGVNLFADSDCDKYNAARGWYIVTLFFVLLAWIFILIACCCPKKALVIATSVIGVLGVIACVITIALTVDFYNDVIQDSFGWDWAGGLLLAGACLFIVGGIANLIATCMRSDKAEYV